jgi:hypothetical protein
MINELNINSVIATPGHDEVLPINALTTQKPYTMKGYAYSGEFPFLLRSSSHRHHPCRIRCLSHTVLVYMYFPFFRTKNKYTSFFSIRRKKVEVVLEFGLG